MARVTVEDCLRNVKNRFELVIVAAQRARQLMRGKETKDEWDNDKPTVVALREIAAGFTTAQNVNNTETHEEHTAEILHVVAIEKTVISVSEPAVSEPEEAKEDEAKEDEVNEDAVNEDAVKEESPSAPTEEE